MMGQRTLFSGLAGMAVLAAVAGVFGLATSAPEAVLSRSYENALSDVDAVWERRTSGHLWLSHAPASVQSSSIAPLQFNPLERALAVGDRISIAAVSGAEEAIEVVAIEHVGGEGLGLAGVQFQIVTGRVARGSGPETVRFLFAVDAVAGPDVTTGASNVDRSL
jgi:hypothetical protein